MYSISKKIFILLITLFAFSSFTNPNDVFRAQYDKQKAWHSSKLADIEYLNRLCIEFKDVRVAINEYTSRMKRLNTKYIVESIDSIDFKIKGAVSYYDYTNIHFPNFYSTTIGIHEFQHLLTYGNFYMSDYAKDLYRVAFDSSKVGNSTIGAQTFLSRNSQPTEMDANRVQLSFEMERLGIKKYNEKFTLEHYKKLLYCLSKGLFTNQGAVDFLIVVKPRYVCQIFNTIA